MMLVCLRPCTVIPQSSDHIPKTS